MRNNNKDRKKNKERKKKKLLVDCDCLELTGLDQPPIPPCMYGFARTCTNGEWTAAREQGVSSVAMRGHMRVSGLTRLSRISCIIPGGNGFMCE